MDKFKRSTKKIPTLRLVANSTSSSSTSKTTSYTEEENEYNPDFQYDTWEFNAIQKESSIKKFFAERQARQKTVQPSILELVLEDRQCCPEDSISPRKEWEMTIPKHPFTQQDSIIVSRTRIKERCGTTKSSISPVQCFSLPSSPRKPITDIHKFNLSSSAESSDYELSAKRTFSDSSIVKPKSKSKQVSTIGRSRSHRFKKKKWHSSLRFTSIHSPRKRRYTCDSIEYNT